jgi:hypothetical protein
MPPPLCGCVLPRRDLTDAPSGREISRAGAPGRRAVRPCQPRLCLPAGRRSAASCSRPPRSPVGWPAAPTLSRPPARSRRPRGVVTAAVLRGCAGDRAATSYGRCDARGRRPPNDGAATPPRRIRRCHLFCCCFLGLRGGAPFRAAWRRHVGARVAAARGARGAAAARRRRLVTRLRSGHTYILPHRQNDAAAAAGAPRASARGAPAAPTAASCQNLRSAAPAAAACRVSIGAGARTRRRGAGGGVPCRRQNVSDVARCAMQAALPARTRAASRRARARMRAQVPRGRAPLAFRKLCVVHARGGAWSLRPGVR